jgi:hypothetical protein
MKDVAGRELEIGDIVACAVLGSPELRLRRIERFTPQKAVVTYNKYTKSGTVTDIEYKFPYQVCFVRKPVAVEKDLSCSTQ